MAIMKAGIWKLPTSLFIRQYLHQAGAMGASPYDMWKSLRDQRRLLNIKCGTYPTFSNCVVQLRKLGLIEVIREEPSLNPGFKSKKFYKIVETHKNSKMWRNPRAYLYADSWQHSPSKP